MVAEILRLPGECGSANDPQNISKIAAQLAKDKTQKQHVGYDLLAGAAAFRDKIESVGAEDKPLLDLQDYMYGSESWKFRDGDMTTATMAWRIRPPNMRSVCFIVS